MNGLTTSQIIDLQKEHGLNELVKANKKSLFSILINQFNNTLIIILIVAAIISAFHDVTEAIVIGVIIVLNAAVGFFQEFRTEKTLEALNNMISPSIRVIRDGQDKMIETKFLVPGDIVVLSEGDKIPADGLLVQSNNIRAEESALTGESVPVEKYNHDELFMGTSLVRGSGLMQVMSIGSQTKFGEIAELTTNTTNTQSPIQKELASIGVFVAKMAGIISALLMIIHVLRNMGGDESLFQVIAEGFTFAVSVAIAAVPEGLATTITVALALGASVLAKKNAIIKKLSSTETLGAVSTICSDKTGTLTKNEMTVRVMVSSDNQYLDISGVGYNPENGKVETEPKDIREFLRMSDIAYYCNEAKLIQNNEGVSILGDPTEAAMLTMAEKVYLSSGDDKTDYIQESIFPFDSNRKLMSVVATNTMGNSFVFVKGSPDHVLDKCTHFWNGEESEIITAEKNQEIQSVYDDLASQALRVLALAYKPIKEYPEKVEHAESELIYVGLVGMIDPPREDVESAIVETKKAGIRTIVITGDYGITASVIASELGIVEKGNHRIITGDELETIDDESLAKILNNHNRGVIFARSLPAQKMRIVEALQKNGEVVAMTGDGVNDAPALKRADIGVAMGITGTAVSKEAATLILLDDSFSTIVRAVREGRRIYDNLKKFVLYTLSSNVGELVVIFISILSGIPLILTAILILTINLGTDILPAIALGVDPGDDDLMERQPRDPQSRVLDNAFLKRLFIIGGIIGISVIAAFVYTLISDGWTWGTEFNSETLKHGQTLAFATLVIIQLMNSFSVKSTLPITLRQIFNNNFQFIAIIISLVIVLLVVYLPFFNQVIGTMPLYGADWLVIGIASIVPIIIFENIKRFNTKKIA
ncbi:MAG: Ca2+-transporting ATPase [Crocinitomicaceae bacterium]|jgi:Ca2+-transporting ATPase